MFRDVPRVGCQVSESARSPAQRPHATKRRPNDLPSSLADGPAEALLRLQSTIGNARVGRVLAVQRDGPQAPPTPAPAGPYAPPPPPVPGTPEFEEQEAQRAGEKAGAEWGTFEADVRTYLSVVDQARPTPEQRRKEVQKILAESEKLPPIEEPEQPRPAEAYRKGFQLHYGSSLTAGIAFATVVNIGFELIKSRNLRLPSMKWGRWAGTAGNSKFLFNAEGIAKFKIDKVPWIRFTNGKADFSAVAYMVEGKASLRVPGLTGDRSNDYTQTVKSLAQIWGKKQFEVEQFLSSNELRVHHYKGDLIQLVPANYHRIGHQGTVADFKAIAAGAVGTTAGLYALLATFEEGK